MNVAAAPKSINTIEKPSVKRIKGDSLIFVSNSSLYVVPEMYEIQPGINGNTHGERKLINPAEKAINNSVILTSIFHSS